MLKNARALGCLTLLVAANVAEKELYRIFFKVCVLMVGVMFASSLSAGSCSEYNLLGPSYQSLEELHNNRITKSQIELVREATALKAARVSALQYTPQAMKLKDIVDDKTQLAELASGTSTLVRVDCYHNPGKDFNDSVSDQFDVVVEYIHNKYK